MMQHTLTYRNGHFTVAALTYNTYFGAAGSAAVLEREGALLVLPLAGQAGGLLLKQKNSVGDRVMLVSDVLERLALVQPLAEGVYAVAWDTHMAGLRVIR